MAQPTKRSCLKGHIYFKSNDCPVCPICEKDKIPQAEFLTVLPAPARRAMEREGIDSIEVLLQYSFQDLLAFHGIGEKGILKLQEYLKANGYERIQD